jgi:hypothetical protein
MFWTKNREARPIVVEAPPEWLAEAADRVERRLRELGARASRDVAGSRSRVASPLRVALMSLLFLAVVWLVFLTFWDSL